MTTLPVSADLIEALAVASVNAGSAPNIKVAMLVARRRVLGVAALTGITVRTNHGDRVVVDKVVDETIAFVAGFDHWHPSHLFVDANTTLRQVIDAGADTFAR